MEHDQYPDEPTPPVEDEQTAHPAPPAVAPLDANAAPSDDETDRPVEEPAARRGVLPKVLAGLGALALIAILAMQAYIVVSANNTASQVESLETAMSDLSTDVARVEGSVDEVGTQVAEIEAAASNSPPAAASSAAPGNPPAAAVPAGSLPRFEPGQQDAALGLPLGNVAGDEYYTQTALDVDPADGTARMWIIWAHWCPYCQEELPEVSEWWTENGDSFENVEVVSVTTSIDPSRGNELVPYLDDLQLPFATLVDDDLAMATQLGVSAFPFWIITDGEGTVLYRSAGLMGMEQIESIAGQLEELAA
jgi:thiol-disulfide isomerase/thioredoxin